MKRQFIFLLFPFFLLGLNSCKKEITPEDIYSVPEMIPVIKDMQIAYAGVDVTVALQEEKERKYDELNVLILEKNNMDKQKFFRSFEWYESKPAIMDEIYTQVIDELTIELDNLQKQGGGRNEPAPTNNDNNGQANPSN